MGKDKNPAIRVKERLIQLEGHVPVAAIKLSRVIMINRGQGVYCLSADYKGRRVKVRGQLIPDR